MTVEQEIVGAKPNSAWLALEGEKEKDLLMHWILKTPVEDAFKDSKLECGVFLPNQLKELLSGTRTMMKLRPDS